MGMILYYNVYYKKEKFYADFEVIKKNCTKVMPKKLRGRKL
jgi:hypothetical protein